MRIGLLLFLAATLQAQPTLRPLHVSSAGIVLDDTGKPVLLRGLNRSATGYGNADATATDAQYAAQNQLLSMNLVRIFVNAAWWNNNVQVPIANMAYRDYVDLLIQRVKKYGNYALILKAGQFPDAPCGADGKGCTVSNQGDVNCQTTPSTCAAQATTGANIDTAFMFWAAFAQKYSGDPAVLYDTWEDMHGIDMNTWSDDQNQLIAAIRAYSPQSVIFVEDTGAEFEAILSGALPDLVWSNLVWNFHLFTASSGACTEPASPRYNNWPANFDPLATFAQQHGHAVGIMEWGGCNDPEPYHTNITSYAKAHDVTLAYFDSSNLITLSGGNSQLTALGTKVATAYTAIAASGPGTVA
ncbi:MAG TPA: cellulase family glycosylhydrolase, partial [Bryobacteraceae bacterium]|nr:cellulase family glycosylhydrolase [Bryobacteraceae bacterium]